MKQYLLREYYELCPGNQCQDLLTESDKEAVKNGKIILTGVIQCADTKNGNGREYPKGVLEREIKKYQQLINDRRAVGELNHPDTSEVDLKNASHLMTKVWWNGNQVMGKLEVLSTPSGQILRNLIDDGIKLGISSRGLGSVTQRQGSTIVEDDFDLICFDIVHEPSTNNAFMLREHKELLKQNKRFKKLQRLMEEISSS